jgi:glutathione-specific gamma-glutamylcyclotransferase
MTAGLRGYSRAFNKLSVRNWGTRLHPGPTLNRVAFEFPKSRRGDIVAYLIRREGKDFTLGEQPIVLEGGVAATALVPLARNIDPLRE